MRRAIPSSIADAPESAADERPSARSPSPQRLAAPELGPERVSLDAALELNVFGPGGAMHSLVASKRWRCSKLKADLAAALGVPREAQRVMHGHFSIELRLVLNNVRTNLLVQQRYTLHRFQTAVRKAVAHGAKVRTELVEVRVLSEGPGGAPQGREAGGLLPECQTGSLAKRPASSPAKGPASRSPSKRQGGLKHSGVPAKPQLSAALPAKPPPGAAPRARPQLNVEVVVTPSDVRDPFEVHALLVEASSTILWGSLSAAVETLGEVELKPERRVSLQSLAPPELRECRAGTDAAAAGARTAELLDSDLVGSLTSGPWCNLALILRDDADLEERRSWIRRVARHPAELQRAGRELQGDSEVVLAAVRQDGLALRHATPGLQACPEVVAAAVRRNGRALEFASEGLRRDQTAGLLALRQNTWALEHVSEGLVDERAFVLTALREGRVALGSVPRRFHADRELVLLAIQRDGFALYYASEELRADKEVVLQAVRRCGRALEYAADFLRMDREVAYAAVQSDAAAIPWVGSSLRADREFLLAAQAGTCEAFRDQCQQRLSILRRTRLCKVG